MFSEDETVFGQNLETHISTFQLPFIIVNTSKKTVIDCSISNDKMEYLFNFDDTFEIHDDMEVNDWSIVLGSWTENK